MKQILTIIIFLAAFISIPCCKSGDGQEPEQASVDTAAINASIDSLGAVVQKAHDTKDDKLLASTWAKDGILSIAGNPPIRGRNAIVSALGNIPPLPPGAQ